MEGWPRRKPFSGAEKPPIAFIRDLKKQVRIGPLLRGEGKFAISDRAKAAHGISNPSATRRGLKYREKGLVPGSFRLPIHRKRSRQRLADASPKAEVTITGN